MTLHTPSCSPAHTVGKSSLAGEIADILEGQLPYAAIDMDWLAWYDTSDAPEKHEPSAVGLNNLSDVVRNYFDVGIRLFVIAAAIRQAWEVGAAEESCRCG